MRVGILGSGLMGGKLGTLFARAGHEVVFSYARSERKPRAARLVKGASDVKRAVPTPPARGVVDPAMCRQPRERAQGKQPS